MPNPNNRELREEQAQKEQRDPGAPSAKERAENDEKAKTESEAKARAEANAKAKTEGEIARAAADNQQSSLVGARRADADPNAPGPAPLPAEGVPVATRGTGLEPGHVTHVDPAASPNAPTATRGPGLGPGYVTEGGDFNPPATRPLRQPVDGADDGTLGGPPPRAATAQRSPQSRYDYSVAPGKSITSPRGVLGEGTEVFVADFSDGQKQVDYLVQRGILVRGGSLVDEHGRPLPKPEHVEKKP